MSRFCNGLMVFFRIVQLILSLAALVCGAFITYTMFSMSSAAHHLETSLDNLNSTSERHAIEIALNITDDAAVQTSLEVLDSVLTPILHFFEGTPVRAIILTAVGMWSISVIIYLLVAQRKTNNPKLNKRSIRITLELITLILWIAGIVCATLLAAEYGAIIFAGGAEVKLAWSAVKPVIAKALESLVADDSIARELDIVNDIFNIGALSILAVVAACVCGSVSFVSLLMACCISGKSKQKHGRLESGAMESLAPMSTDKPGFSLSGSSTPASWPTPTPLYHSAASQGYSPAPQYTSPHHEDGGESWGR